MRITSNVSLVKLRRPVDSGSRRWRKGSGGGGFVPESDIGSRRFNGLSDRIVWPAGIMNLAGVPWTFSVWVRVLSDIDYIHLFNGHQAGDTFYGVALVIRGGLRVGVSRAWPAGEAAWYPAAGVMSLNTWTHLTFTSDGAQIANSVAVYVNGASQVLAFTAGIGSEVNVGGSWALGGCLYPNVPITSYHGDMAQVRVFDRVLTAPEIALEAAGVVTTTSGLVFYWKGNKNADVISQVSGQTGTLHGTSFISGAGNGPVITYV